MDNPNGNITKAEFAQFEKRIVFRLKRLERKMDKINDKVIYIYGFAGGIGLVAGIAGSVIL